MKKIRNVISVMLALLMCFSLAMPVSAANTQLTFTAKLNKANVNNYWEKNNSFSVTVDTKVETTVKGNTLSAKVYIPQAALKSNNSAANVYFEELLYDENSQYIGSVYGAKSFVVNVNSGKATISGTSEGKNDKKTEMTAADVKKYAKLKKSGKYYILSLTNIPLQSYIYKDSEKVAEIDSEVSYNIEKRICLTFASNKKASYTFGLDDFVLKADDKAISKDTFSKDTEGIYINRGSEQISYKLKTLK